MSATGGASPRADGRAAAVEPGAPLRDEEPADRSLCESTASRTARRVWRLRGGMLLAWAAVTFGIGWFAHDLDVALGGWPFNYWMAAQGGVLVFIAIVTIYAAVMNRLDQADVARADGQATVHEPD